MKYGIDFFVVGPDGKRIESDGKLTDKKYYPPLHPFKYADGAGGWWLTSDFTIDVRINGRWFRVTAKAWFDYDGASIPRLMRTIVGGKMDADVIVAAMFHDLFYCAHHWLFTKDVSDRFFAGVQGVYGATPAQQVSTYQAVHLFGGGPWREDGATKMDKYAPMLIVVELAA